MRWRAALALIGLVAVLPSASRAEGAAPDAATLLFDEPQLATTKPGDILTYAYSRKTADPAQFGPSFEDRIRLVVDHGANEATRTVQVELFSGARRRPAGPFDDMIGNPLLSLVLEQNIQGLATQFAANPRYFKTAIRAALRERASVVAEQMEVAGRLEPGWRVTITPFRDEANKARMRGLDALAYEFRIAKAVPGEIVEIRISAPGGPSGPLLEEKVDYVAKAD